MDLVSFVIGCLVLWMLWKCFMGGVKYGNE